MQSSDMLPSELLLRDKNLCDLLVGQDLAVFLYRVVADFILFFQGVQIFVQAFAYLLVCLVLVQSLLKLHI